MSRTIPQAPRENGNNLTFSVAKNGIYPARLVKFIGYGMQAQPDFRGEAKPDAFKVALTFELYDPATGQPLDSVATNEAGEQVTRPACAFQDMYFFPGAQRGKVFDLCNAIEPGIAKVPAEFDWFVERLGAAVQVAANQWTSKKSGKVNLGVNDVSGIPPMVANAMPQARTELLSFFPYDDSLAERQAYAKLIPFQREILTEAKDVANIPLAGTEPETFDEAEAQQAHSTATPAEAAPVAATSTDAPTAMNFDDDIPFAPEYLPFGKKALYCI